MRKIVITLACLCVCSFAQIPQPIVFVTTDPAGACTVGVALQYNRVNGDLSGCKAGTWTVVAGTSASVSSFNTRTGAVVPAGGDYTAAQVTNAVSSLGSYANPAWITAIPASILSGWTTTNDTNITGSFSSGTFTLGWAGTLAKGRMLGTVVYNDQANTYGAFYQDYHSASFRLPEKIVSGLPAASSQVGLVYTVTDGTSTSDCVTGGGAFRALCNSNGTAWVPLGGTGGGGSGATAVYQLTDFQVVKTSSSEWTMNSAASSSAPVAGRIGDVSYRFTAPATITVSGTSSTGSVYWCLFNDGSLQAYSSLAATFTVSGIAMNSGSSCPNDTAALWATTMTANVPDAITEAMDNRAAFLVAPHTLPGSFMSASKSGNFWTLGIDPTQVSGTGTKLGSIAGAVTNGHYAGYDATGALIDAGTGTAGVTAGTCIQGSGTVTTVSLDNSGSSTSCPPTQSQIQAGKPIKLTTTSSSGTTYTATGSPTYAAYTQDAQFMFDIGGTACTPGAVTLNIDGLGAKRIYETDGATNPVAGDCAAHQILMLSYDSSGNFRIIGGGAPPSGSGCPTCLPPFTQTTIHEHDDFFPAQFYGIGALGWQSNAAIGSGGSGFVKGYTGHPGVIAIFTSSASGDTTVMNLESQNTGGLNWLSLGTTAGLSTWEVRFTVLTDDNANTSTSQAFELGFKDSNTYRSGNSIAFRYDTTSATCSSGTNSTTNFMLESFATGTSTCIDTGVAVAGAQWFTFDIVSTSLGTVIGKISTNGGAFSSPVTISSNVPTAALFPTFLVATRTASPRRISVDYWEILLTGLTR